MKEIFRNMLSEKAFKMIKSVYLWLLSLPYGYNLSKLSQIYKSDKWGAHFYTRHYQTHFRKLKFKSIKLLEIGVGGYHYPKRGGSSLRMWKRYFPFAQVFALDIYDKSFCEESRIKIFQGSQVDEEVLSKMVAATGPLDIIIDDGSHINEHVIRTFTYLFPHLKNGGIYVIEDTETSYWPDYGGDSDNLNNPTTLMNFFKSLTDCPNHVELIKPDYSPSYFDQHVYSIQFYHNLIFIFKDLNTEKSNVDFTNPESVLADKMYV